jgi:hypothetical protein
MKVRKKKLIKKSLEILDLEELLFTRTKNLTGKLLKKSKKAA